MREGDVTLHHSLICHVMSVCVWCRSDGVCSVLCVWNRVCDADVSYSGHVFDVEKLIWGINLVCYVLLMTSHKCVNLGNYVLSMIIRIIF